MGHYAVGTARAPTLAQASSKKSKPSLLSAGILPYLSLELFVYSISIAKDCNLRSHGKKALKQSKEGKKPLWTALSAFWMTGMAMFRFTVTVLLLFLRLEVQLVRHKDGRRLLSASYRREEEVHFVVLWVVSLRKTAIQVLNQARDPG